VLQNLLKEQVSIRDLLTILETLGDHANLTKDPLILTEFVRSALSRTITKKLVDEKGQLSVLTLDPSIEERISQSIVQTEHGVQAVVEPGFLANLVKSLKNKLDEYSSTSYNQVLLVSPVTRAHLRRLLERFLPNVTVISHQEIQGTSSLNTIGEVKLNNAG
jgi:flagellar biosynthesis protein FlhA